MYPSRTRYVNWEFSFAHSGLEASITARIDVFISKDGQPFGRSTSEVLFNHEAGVTRYIDGYGSDEARIWTAGAYDIAWSIGGSSIAQSEFTVSRDDLTKGEIVEGLRVDAFEVYFKDSVEGKRDYAFFDNYRFPHERVGLIGWRITFNLPYSVNNYDLETRINIRRTDSGQADLNSTGTMGSSGPLPGISGELPWVQDRNWPRGSYRMEVFVGDRAIASRKFSII